MSQTSVDRIFVTIQESFLPNLGNYVLETSTHDDSFPSTDKYRLHEC